MHCTASHDRTQTYRRTTHTHINWISFLSLWHLRHCLAHRFIYCCHRRCRCDVRRRCILTHSWCPLDSATMMRECKSNTRAALLCVCELRSNCDVPRENSVDGYIWFDCSEHYCCLRELSPGTAKVRRVPATQTNACIQQTDYFMGVRAQCALSHSQPDREQERERAQHRHRLRQHYLFADPKVDSCPMFQVTWNNT